MPPSVVLVTDTEFRRSEAVFTSTSAVTCVEAPSPEEELCAMIPRAGARHVIVGGLPYRDRLYTTLARGSVLARYGVGHDGIDKVRATAAGLLCTNTPGVLDQSVAELTMLLISASARHLLALATDLRAGTWAPRTGVELMGKTLAIVGCGRIGRKVARLAATAFQMRIIGCRRGESRWGASTGDPDFDHTTSDFHEAAREADYVSLHIPATQENLGFINRERIASMREHAWLINTARGVVVDELALYDALANQRIGGLASDVFEREPYVPAGPSHDLRSLPNVIMVPHVGSNTVEANRRMAERALQNIVMAEAGNFAALDLLNPEVLAGR